VIGRIPRAYQFAGASLELPLPASELVRCDRCWLFFRDPAPSVDELSALYQRNKFDKWDYSTSVRPDWRIGRELLTATGNGGRILDIGCWNGEFLAMLQPDWECYGVEIHAEAARLAADRGIQMIAKTLYQIEGFDEAFDAVTAFDVIEHVHNPADLLDNMLKLVKPGGLVLVGTGNTQAFSWRLMGSRYYYCTAAEHIAFISTKWSEWYARSRRVTFVEAIHFSHAPRRSALNRLKQTAANLTCRLAPALFGRLRAAGVGRLDVSQDSARRHTPPSWMTARDHILAVFQKPLDP
jgi:2-polyprenyl-3-methyl-5-hydroxy-6-metoxy-1,4-benzoquinol methylase